MRLFRNLAHKLVTLVTVASLGGCARGIVVGSYPIDDGHPSSPPGSEEENQGAYWSAYVEIEGQDISRLWNLDGLDYVLITAEVSIPTASGPLVRSVPLFTVEKGMINYESGVDLLKKMPLHTNARDQVTFQLQVTVLDDIEALKAARKILGTVSDLAKPFLSNYPLASKILESSLPLIDQFAKPSKKPASSAKTAIVSERLFRDAVSSPTHDVLFAYFLVPQRSGKGKEDSDNAGTNTDIKGWLLEHLGLPEKKDDETTKTVLRECGDKEGHLCLASSADSVTFDESALMLAYATVRSELAAGNCPSDAASTFGELYSTLSSSEDGAIKRNLDKAFDTLKATCDKVSIPKKAATKGTTKGEKEGTTKTAEGHSKANVTSTSPDERELAMKSVESLLQASFSALDEHLRNRGNTTRYMHDRVDQVAYVTIKFKRYSEVHDPFMIIDPTGDDCGTLTAARVSEVENYIRDNQSLFLPEHIDYARSLVAAANAYLELVDLVDRGAYSEALSLIASHVMLQEERSWAWSEYDTLLNRAPSSLENARMRLERCFQRKLAIPPYAQIAWLGKLYVNPEVSNRASRLNELLEGLQEAALILGDQAPKLGSTLEGKLSESPIARALFGEASQLRTEELASAKATSCTAFKGTSLDLYFSKTCDECLTELEKRCKDRLDDELQRFRNAGVTGSTEEGGGE